MATDKNIDKPWLAQYDQEVPETLAPYPKFTILDYLKEAASASPNAKALIYRDPSIKQSNNQRCYSHITYGELERLSQIFCKALINIGVTKNDRVLLIMPPNTWQFVVAQFGIWKAEAIVVPLNPLYTQEEFLKIIPQFDAKTAVIFTPLFVKIFRKIRREAHLDKIILTDIDGFIAPLKQKIAKLISYLVKSRTDLYFDKLLEKYADNNLIDGIPVNPDDPAVILMTGGTTGKPKGAVGLHRSLVISGLQLQTWLRTTLKDGGTFLMPLPLFHVYASVGAQSLAIINRNPIALANATNLREVIEAIVDLKPAFFSAVPKLIIAILNHPEIQAEKVDLKSIKLTFSGASALMAETRRQWEAVTGTSIIEGYSLTEGMMACILNPIQKPSEKIALDDGELYSIGVPLPDISAKIIDIQDGKILPPNQKGELIINAPQIMQKYWNNPEETELAIRTYDEKLWLHTGDVAVMSDTGRVFLIDRLKDMIKPANPSNHSFETQSKTAVRNRSISSQIQIPLVIFHFIFM